MTLINNYEDYRPEFGKFRLLYCYGTRDTDIYYFHKNELVQAYKIMLLRGCENFHNLAEVCVSSGEWLTSMPVTEIPYGKSRDLESLILEFYEKIKHVTD